MSQHFVEYVAKVKHTHTLTKSYDKGAAKQTSSDKIAAHLVQAA